MGEPGRQALRFWHCAVPVPADVEVSKGDKGIKLQIGLRQIGQLNARDNQRALRRTAHPDRWHQRIRVHMQGHLKTRQEEHMLWSEAEIACPSLLLEHLPKEC